MQGRLVINTYPSLLFKHLLQYLSSHSPHLIFQLKRLKSDLHLVQGIFYITLIPVFSRFITLTVNTNVCRCFCVTYTTCSAFFLRLSWIYSQFQNKFVLIITGCLITNHIFLFQK